MANQDLVEYIRKARSKGHQDQKIRLDLVSEGWAQNDVDDAFRDIVETERLAKKAESTAKRKRLLSKIAWPATFVLIIAVIAFAYLSSPHGLSDNQPRVISEIEKKSDCPSVPEFPFEDWNPVIIDHPWKNDDNKEDIIDLSIVLDDMGNAEQSDRWDSFLRSIDYSDYVLLEQTPKCFSGTEGLGEEEGNSYCHIKIGRPDGSEIRFITLVFHRSKLIPASVKFDHSSDYELWTFTNITFIESYCS